MPFPVQKANDNIDLLIPFCFTQGGTKIGKFFLFHKKDTNSYFFREFKVIEGKPKLIRPGNEYHVDEEGKSFLLHLFDEHGDHLENDFVLPVFNSHGQSTGFFEGSFKFARYNEDCGFKHFVIGHPPPSQNAVSSVLEFSAGKGEPNERKRKTKSRKSRKSRIGNSRKQRKNLSK
jgi:hypothetical protein